MARCCPPSDLECLFAASCWLVLNYVNLQTTAWKLNELKLPLGSEYNWFVLQCAGINAASCKIAREVANEGDALVAGGLSQCPTYLSGEPKEKVQAEFKIQLDDFVKNKVDFLICEVR